LVQCALYSSNHFASEQSLLYSKLELLASLSLKSELAATV